MIDINGNELSIGDMVYVLTTPHSGSKSKRLFFAEVIRVSSGIATAECVENKRVVRVQGCSIVKPLEKRKP